MSLQETVTQNTVSLSAPAGDTQPDGSAVLYRTLRERPKTVIGSSGNYLQLENGQAIFDASGGAAVSCLGHGNERVKQAMMAQLEANAYSYSLFFSSPAGEKLAKLLVDSTDGVMSKALIVSSGSEAVEAALKLSRQYFMELSPPQPQRIRFIARKPSYHGTTLGALSVGGHVTRRALFEPMLNPNFSHVSPFNPYRGLKEGEDTEAYIARLAQELDDEFQRVGPDTVCAFFAEPVVGAALGCVGAAPGYFKAMKAVCERYGALMVMDEVMSGMGRTGTLHAWEQEGVSPDIQTFGKALGAGYVPIAGLLVSKKVVDVLDKGTGSFAHGQTYQGHPVACAAAFEVQTIIKEQKLLENVRKMGAYLGDLLKQKLDSHPNVGEVRGRGLFWGIEFVKDKASKEPFDTSLGVAQAIHKKALQPGYDISVLPATGSVDGTRGDHIIISPAYNITEADVETIVDRVQKAIEDYFTSLSA
ncbi:hypothetical protein DTO045G8_839 [Paecilomyces variotii]|nr:hypothetical protein DTO045G8_839 [Paecilomyces variotii]